MRGMWIKNSVLLLGMTLTGAALLAQQATAPVPDAATQNTAQAASEAQLTVEQRKQLTDMRGAARDQAAIIKNDPTLNQDQKRAKIKELRATTREQMKSLLTPEQQKAFADRRAAGKARFAAKLGLTTEQKTKLKELFGSTHQQRETVLKNASLTNDQKQAQLSQIRQTSQTQLATILTPEQLAKFQQMRQRHHHSKQG